MGWNTGVLVCNDIIHEIDKNPASWWDRLREAFDRRKGREPVSFYGGMSTAAWQEHADTMGLLVVGGNCATRVVSRTCDGRHDELNILGLLRDAADKYGYRLVRKPKLKRNPDCPYSDHADDCDCQGMGGDR